MGNIITTLHKNSIKHLTAVMLMHKNTNELETVQTQVGPEISAATLRCHIDNMHYSLLEYVYA